MEKKIETIELNVGDVTTDFGNPRKIGKKKFEELKESLRNYGDFGIFLIDEHNRIIAGNQRLAALKAMDYDGKILCKKLIGYTEAELRAINIKDNTHAGEWDLDLLADWTADLNLDLGLDLDIENPEDKRVPDMDPIRYEKYNYIMIMCKSELDYNNLINRLGLDAKRKIKINEKKKVLARACWYNEIEEKIK